MLSRPNNDCKCFVCLPAHGDHTGQLDSSVLQEAVMEGMKLAARCEVFGQPGVEEVHKWEKKEASELVGYVCVCETHPHIWSRLCWRWSLVDRCTRSCRQCWCILLHRTHQGWCCIHRYLKHTPDTYSHIITIPQSTIPVDTSVEYTAASQLGQMFRCSKCLCLERCSSTLQ